MSANASRFTLPAVGATLLLGLAAVHVVAGQDPGGINPAYVRGVDLSCYWVGGKILAEGDDEELYLRARSKAELKRLFPPKPVVYPLAYPPPIYQLFALPQPTVPYAVASRVLLGLMGVLHLLGAWMVLRATPGGGRWRNAILAAAFVCPGAVSVIVSGQLAGLWLTFLGAGLWLMRRGSGVLGGVCFAGLWMKPTLAAPLLLALVVLGDGAAVLGMILGGAAILGLSLLAGGTVAWSHYISLMLAPEGVLASMFKHLDRQLTLRALMAGLAPKAWAPMAGWFGAALGAALMLGVAWLGRPPTPRRAAMQPDVLAVALRFGATLVAAFLASPHFYEYDAGLHLPASMASIAWLASGRAQHPRLGAALAGLAFLAGGLVLVNKPLGFNLATVLVFAWVCWMGAELWGLRGRDRGPAAAAGEAAQPRSQAPVPHP